MPEKIVSMLERIMRNFFWEGHNGSRINHLVKWNPVTQYLADEGLSIGGLRAKNFAILAKWEWKYLDKENSLWCQVVKSIHGKDSYNWHTAGMNNNSLRSPWISITRTWPKVDALATFKHGNGTRTIWFLWVVAIQDCMGLLCSLRGRWQSIQMKIPHHGLLYSEGC